MFCSKCGRQINYDALFCTFCGSPTGLAAQPAPTAPVPAAPNAPGVSDSLGIPNVPAPQSIPMSSEDYSSIPVGGTSQSIPVQNAEGYSPIEGSDSTESVIGGYGGAADSLSVTDEFLSGNTENDVNPTLPVSDSAEPANYGENASLRLEQPALSTPVQPVFAVQDNTAAPELAAAGTTAITDFSAPVQPQPAEEPDKRAKYTFGHIALCLAAVGVMAIVAGIFAGLYFSVI